MPMIQEFYEFMADEESLILYMDSGVLEGHWEGELDYD